jgi:hypothetical protein
MTLTLIAGVISIAALVVSLIYMSRMMTKGLREVSSALNRMTGWFQEQDDMQSPYRNGTEPAGKRSTGRGQG